MKIQKFADKEVVAVVESISEFTHFLCLKDSDRCYTVGFCSNLKWRDCVVFDSRSKAVRYFGNVISGMNHKRMRSVLIAKNNYNSETLAILNACSTSDICELYWKQFA